MHSRIDQGSHEKTYPALHVQGFLGKQSVHVPSAKYLVTNSSEQQLQKSAINSQNLFPVF